MNAVFGRDGKKLKVIKSCKGQEIVASHDHQQPEWARHRRSQGIKNKLEYKEKQIFNKKFFFKSAYSVIIYYYIYYIQGTSSN